MAGENHFYYPPGYVVNNCVNSTTATGTPTSPPPPPQLTPNQSTAVQQLLALLGYARKGTYVLASKAGAGGADVGGYVEDISTDGKNVTIADVESGTKTTISSRFINFWSPVDQVTNHYAPIYPTYVGQNNFHGSVGSVHNYYGRSAQYRSLITSSTLALQLHLLTSR